MSWRLKRIIDFTAGREGDGKKAAGREMIRSRSRLPASAWRRVNAGDGAGCSESDIAHLAASILLSPGNGEYGAEDVVLAYWEKRKGYLESQLTRCLENMDPQAVEITAKLAHSLIERGDVKPFSGDEWPENAKHLKPELVPEPGGEDDLPFGDPFEDPPPTQEIPEPTEEQKAEFQKKYGDAIREGMKKSP